MVYPLVLYSQSERSFTSNGLGTLSDAVSCTVTEEANGSFELEMVYPVSGKHYNDIVNRSLIFAKPNPFDRAQPFRIYKISKPMDGQVTIFAAHITYDTAGYPVRPFTAHSASEVMNHLEADVIVSNPFRYTTDVTTSGLFEMTAPASIRSILGGSDTSIIEIYGGELKYDWFDVKLLKSRGHDNGVVIRYGKNLTDLTQEESCADVYSDIYPYYENSTDNEILTLSEGTLPTGGSTDFKNVAVVDFSSEFDEAPLEAELRAKALQYIQDNDLKSPSVSLTVSFMPLEQTEEYKNVAPLEKVELFDTVHVEFPMLGVSTTAKVSQTVYNVLNDRYDSVTIGEVRTGVSKSVADTEVHLVDETRRYRSELSKTSGDLSSRLTITENGLTSKVSKGDVVSTINQSAEQITLTSNRLVVKSNNFQLDEYGRVYIVSSLGFKSSEYGSNTTILSLDGRGMPALTNLGNITASGTIDFSNANDVFLPPGAIDVTVTNSDLYGLSPNFSSVGANSITCNGLSVTAGGSEIPLYGKVTVYGSFYVPNIDSATVTKEANCAIGSNGKFAKITSSSRRFKHDIMDITTPSLNPESLYLANVRQFVYNTNYLGMDDQRYNQPVPGFIAEELASVYPVAVDLDENGQPVNWNDRYIIPPMLSLIQKQHNEIENLKLDVLRLTSELAQIKEAM